MQLLNKEVKSTAKTVRAITAAITTLKEKACSNTESKSHHIFFMTQINSHDTDFLQHKINYDLQNFSQAQINSHDILFMT